MKLSIWNRVLAQYPRFADTLVSGPEARAITPVELAEASTIARAIAAGQRIFSLEREKHAGQLWFHSLCNALVAPAVTAMVEFDTVPSLDLSAGSLHAVDDFWFGFTTEAVLGDEEWAAAGEQFGRSIRPVVETLCAGTDLRPAPLWAVAADALGLAASQAGVEAFEEEHARAVAVGLIEGLGRLSTVPPPRFGDDNFLRRASCCMIFHSPNADFCLSCPQQV